MLRITVPEQEYWDEQKEEFIYSKEQMLQLEHSLVSLAKWESKWCKPFFGKQEMTREETLDYIRCMTLTQNVDPIVYKNIPSEIIKQVSDYMEAPMTATWFSEDNKKNTPNREIVTNELIYYWMIALQIPMECQKWHLNRLLTLIQVCNIKNAPPKKMGKRELMSRHRALNEARRKKFNK